jgi:hypothetical protein
MSPVRSLSVLLLFIAASTAAADELKTLTGKTVTGTLRTIDPTAIYMRTDEGNVETPLAQALLLDLRPARGVPEGVKYYEVHLLDDSDILATNITYRGRDVELTLVSGATLKVPLTAIVSVLKDAQDAAIRRQFQALLKKGQLRSDRILILKDGELNPIDGTLGEVDPDGQAIAFKRDGSKALKARFAILQGIVFLRTEATAEAALCKVIDQDGNTLHAAKIDYGEGTLNVLTPAGAKIALKNEMLARLDFNLGRLTYLSDMDFKDRPPAFFNGLLAVRRDANQDGRPIVLLDRNFAKGLTLEGGSDVEYNLGGKYKDFKALLGADTRAAEGVFAKTTVTVYGDGTKLQTYTVSPTELLPVAINVKGVSTLKIEVKGPDFTIRPAYATLADARISQ